MTEGSFEHVRHFCYEVVVVAKAEKGGSLFINRGEAIAVPVFFGYNEKKAPLTV